MKMIIFCLFIILSINTAVISQNTESKNIEELNKSEQIQYPSLLDLSKNFNFIQSPPKFSSLLPSPTSIHHTAFFCKMERKADLKTNLPVRLRLGSLDYVNKLEGK